MTLFLSLALIIFTHMESQFLVSVVRNDADITCIDMNNNSFLIVWLSQLIIMFLYI